MVVYLTIEGETLVTTADHPFYTVAGEWVEAGDLRLGDDIRMASWATGDVESVYIVSQPQPMYNFTVATARTYFVGEHQWLVHNSNCWLTNDMPSGRSITEMGQNSIRWGDDVKGAIERREWLQSVSLDEAKNFLGNLTLEEAEYIRDFYKQRYNHELGGQTAWERWKLMDDIIDILS